MVCSESDWRIGKSLGSFVLKFSSFSGSRLFLPQQSYVPITTLNLPKVIGAAGMLLKVFWCFDIIVNTSNT